MTDANLRWLQKSTKEPNKDNGGEMADQFFTGSSAIAEAQKCARMLMEQTGQRTAWCVVTRKGFWPASYFFAGDEDLLRAKLNQGHEVVMAFAVSRRLALAECSGHEAVPLSDAEKLLRRCARRALRHTEISRHLV